jgi:hypothetical protein
VSSYAGVPRPIECFGLRAIGHDGGDAGPDGRAVDECLEIRART